MGKFKPGDLAWSPAIGFGVLERASSIVYNLRQVSDHVLYTVDGYRTDKDLYPTLLTVEEAGRLGHYPPKKKVKKTYYTAAIKGGSGETYLDRLLFADLDAAKVRYNGNPLYNLGIATVTIEVEE